MAGIQEVRAGPAFYKGLETCRLLSSSYIVGTAEHLWDPAERRAESSQNMAGDEFVLLRWVYPSERGQGDHPPGGI